MNWNEAYLDEAEELPITERHVISNYEGRLVIIGDVHGCSEELEELLQKPEIAGAQVVFVGDLVNKGPDSIGCLNLAQKYKALCVRGNHEVAVLVAYNMRKEGKAPLSKYAWTDQLSSDHIHFLKHLPYSILFPKHNLRIVHAGLNPQISHIKEQKTINMITMRDVLKEDNKWKMCEVKKEGSIPWAPLWQGPEHIVFGHDAVRGLQLCEHATGLDTGCLYGKRLTALLVPENRLISVQAKRAYVIPGIPKRGLIANTIRLFFWMAPVLLPLTFKALNSLQGTLTNRDCNK
eukprot:m.196036 g.196036  ORF g.196036 m.196036 type:complete len:291 (-) comp15694_c0_seq19:2207-3079(-)